MRDETLLKRINVNPEIFGGKPIIRGMRISVELILSLLVQGKLRRQFCMTIPTWNPRYPRLYCVCTCCDCA